MTMLNHALAYAARGWHVFPCKPGGKHPHYDVLPKMPKGEGGHKLATTDAATIRQWWSAAPNAHIGLALAPSGLVAVDADLYKPNCGWDGFASVHDVPETLTQRSASGGKHLIFTAAPDSVFAMSIPGAAAVDVKHSGFILLEPSTYEGGTYRFQNDAPIAPAPEWLPRRVRRDHGDSKTPPVDARMSLADIAACLRRIH